MDSQSLPVVNTVAPAPPPAPVVQPATTLDADQDSLPVSSSKRSMVGQTNTSFTNMLVRQASESTDSLISFLDPSPPTPASKGRGRTSTVADPPSTTAPATTVLKTAPAGKSESGIAGIKRLDANMGAMAARIEDHIAQFHEHVADVKDDLTLTRNQLKSFAADATGLGVASGFTAKDMLEHPTIRALVASNNASVGTIDALRAEVTSLTSAMANMRGDHRKRKHDDDTSMYSEDVFLPAVKRVARVSDIASTVAPAYNDIPTAPPPISYVDPTPSAAPGSVPDAPPPVSAQQTTGAVDIGPINWGKDISGQVRGLIGRMSRGKNIDADAVKNVYAKRFPKNNKFVTAYFPTNVAAIQFVNAWEAAPPAGYEKTSVSFASGN